MKKLKYNILAVGLASASLLAVSCADSFLDVDSKINSNTQNFYKTEADACARL